MLPQVVGQLQSVNSLRYFSLIKKWHAQLSDHCLLICEHIIKTWTKYIHYLRDGFYQELWFQHLSIQVNAQCLVLVCNGCRRITVRNSWKSVTWRKILESWKSISCQVLCGYWASKNNSDFSHISARSEITSFTFMFISKILKNQTFETILSVGMHVSVEYQ